MRTIKRYANRKLYDTQTGSYITLEEIAALIRQGEDIEVLDHASGQDLTTITLIQVIFEEEKRANSHLPNAFLTEVLKAGTSFRTSINAILEPETSFAAELRLRMTRLVQKGTITEVESQRILDWLLDPAVKAPPATEVPADAAEVSALQQQVEKLEKLIHDLGG